MLKRLFFIHCHQTWILQAEHISAEIKLSQEIAVKVGTNLPQQVL